MARTLLFWLLVALVGVSACDCGDEHRQTSASSAESAPGAGQTDKAGQGWGTLEGTIRLADGAGLPAYKPAQMERKVLEHTQQSAPPESCTPAKLADRQPVQPTPEGLLSGVMVAASGFNRQQARAPAVHEVTVEDCRLSPRMVVATKGDTLRMTNKVDYPFMPSFGSTSMVRTLTPGQAEEIPLDQGGVQPVLCGFTAPCGRTDVVVVAHGLHAVSDAKGHFRIENFPAGQPVKIHAWHPLFKEAHMELTLKAGETRSVELLIEPSEGAEVPGKGPALPAPDGGTAAAAPTAAQPTQAVAEPTAAAPPAPTAPSVPTAAPAKADGQP